MKHHRFYTLTHLFAVAGLATAQTPAKAALPPAPAPTDLPQDPAQDSAAAPRAEVPPPQIAPPRWAGDSRYAELVMDADTGAIIYDQNADATRQIASLTKVMTAYLVFEALESGALTRDTEMTVSRHGGTLLRTSSLLGLREGNRISVDECLTAMISMSANDCAVTLAEAVAGSEEAFAAQMTARARALGAMETVFKSASGLIPQESTAHDIAKIFAALYKDHRDYFREYFSPGIVELPRGRGDHYNCKLCEEADIGAIGQKTGTTSGSGHSLMTMINNGYQRFVIVALGTPSSESRLERVTAIAQHVQNWSLSQITTYARPRLSFPQNR